MAVFTACSTLRLWMNAAFSLWGHLVSHTVVCRHDCALSHQYLSGAATIGYTCISDSVCFPLDVLRLNISDSDMLTITDGDEVATRILGRYVGGSSPFKLSSTTPDLTVTFHSDPAGLVFGKGEGFIINYMGKNLRRLYQTDRDKPGATNRKSESIESPLTEYRMGIQIVGLSLFKGFALNVL